MPLVSPSCLSSVSSLHLSYICYCFKTAIFSSLSSFVELDFLGPLQAVCQPSPFTSHISSRLFPLCTCSHSYNVHWCHLSSSNEMQHIKISISLARTFRPCWIIHVHISAPHPMTLRKVLLFSSPSNEIWMASFFPLLFISFYSLWHDRLTWVGLMERMGFRSFERLRRKRRWIPCLPYMVGNIQ